MKRNYKNIFLDFETMIKSLDFMRIEEMKEILFFLYLMRKKKISFLSSTITSFDLEQNEPLESLIKNYAHHFFHPLDLTRWEQMDQKFYYHLMEKLTICDPKEVLVVSDNIKKLLIYKKIGMDICLMKNNSFEEDPLFLYADYQIENLKQLKKIP